MRRGARRPLRYRLRAHRQALLLHQLMRLAARSLLVLLCYRLCSECHCIAPLHRREHRLELDAMAASGRTRASRVHSQLRGHILHSALPLH